MKDQHTSPLSPQPNTASPLRPCVYTVLTGRYEQLNEQPTARDSIIPFICLTDSPDLKSETWQMRLIPRLFDMDPIRAQRELKLRPHMHLPEYDFSLYIDNSVLLKQAPEELIQNYFPASGFGLARHSFRESVLDEFLEIASRGLDDQCRVFEQLNHYSMTYPETLEERPYWTGLLLREHGTPEVQAMLDIWYSNVLRYSRRDQLSVNAAFRQAALIPDVMDIDNLESPFHLWPVTIGREVGRAIHTPAESLAISLSPPVARAHQLEREIAQIISERDQVLSSGAWRIGYKMTEIVRRHPRLLGPVLSVARRVLVRD